MHWCDVGPYLIFLHRRLTHTSLCSCTRRISFCCSRWSSHRHTLRPNRVKGCILQLAAASRSDTKRTTVLGYGISPSMFYLSNRMMLLISWLLLLILSCISCLFAAHCCFFPSGRNGSTSERGSAMPLGLSALLCFVVSVHVHFRVLLQEVIFSSVCSIDSLAFGVSVAVWCSWCCYVAMPRLNGIKRWRSETSKSFETVPRPRGRWGNALAIPLVLITPKFGMLQL